METATLPSPDALLSPEMFAQMLSRPGAVDPQDLEQESSSSHLELIEKYKEDIDYSERYYDEVYEYRWVTVPRAMMPVFPPNRVMQEREWRGRGIVMSRGWVHYDIHSPEANVLLFRRPRHTDPKTGSVPPEIMEKVREREEKIAEVEFRRHQLLMAQQADRDD